MDIDKEARLMVLDNKIDAHITRTDAVVETMRADINNLTVRHSELILRIDELKTLLIKMACAIVVVTVGGDKAIDFFM